MKFRFLQNWDHSGSQWQFNLAPVRGLTPTADGEGGRKVRIECSGPNGETFEAETAVNPYNNPTGASNEREAIQKALETWCNTFGVKVAAQD